MPPEFKNLLALDILPPQLSRRFNKSGTIEPSPGIKVMAVRAEHSSPLVWSKDPWLVM